MKKAATKKKTAKKAPAKKKAAATKKPLPKATKKYTARKDLGSPIASFFAKAPANTRPILEALRDLVEETVPSAVSSIKWGMPFYTLNGNMMCAIGGHKSHVNLILSGPPGTFADPGNKLEGNGKTGRHLKLTRPSEIDKPQIKAWLKTAAALAKSK